MPPKILKKVVEPTVVPDRKIVKKVKVKAIPLRVPKAKPDPDPLLENITKTDLKSTPMQPEPILQHKVQIRKIKKASVKLDGGENLPKLSIKKPRKTRKPTEKQLAALAKGREMRKKNKAK